MRETLRNSQGYALLHVIDASCGVVWSTDEKKMHHYGKMRRES